MAANYGIFFVLVALSCYIDKSLYVCDSYLGKIIIVFHHFIAILHFTMPYLFGYYSIYVIASVIMLIGWVLYDNNCLLKYLHNYACGFKKDKTWDSLIWYLLKKFKIPLFFAYFFLCVTLIYSMYKIPCIRDYFIIQ